MKIRYWQSVVGIAAFLVGCTAMPPSRPPQAAETARRHNFGSLLGPEGLTLRGKKEVHPSTQTAVRVNKFLWQGAVETFSFMPIRFASPQTGRLITEWTPDQNTPHVRLRAAVIIRGQTLRADAVTVVVERQKRTNAGTWVPYPFPQKSCTDLEILVVERACQIRKDFLEKAKHPEKPAPSKNHEAHD